MKYSLFKKFLIITVFSFLLIPSLVWKIKAADTFGEHLEASGVPSSEAFGWEQLKGTVFDLARTLGGNPQNPEETGAIQTTTNLIASVYAAPPASGIYYAYDVLQRLGGAPAYAQGVGFTGLQPILPIWKSLRNVSYILLTLVFVFTGLSIMFRAKISPQAVMTIENALPRIIGALILITFSYAIAGLIIDLIYVLMALVIAVLGAGGINVASNPGIINSGLFALSPLFGSSLSGTYLIGLVLGAALGALSGIPTGLAAIVLVPAGAYLGATVGSLLFVVIWFIMALFLLVKLLFGLIKAYIKIILGVILGPIQIIAGIIPGFQSAGFGSWIKGIFAEALIFPAVLAVSLIGLSIANLAFSEIGNLWLAPLIGPPQFQGAVGELASELVGNINGFFVKTIIGMGFLLFLANVPDAIRKAFEIKPGMEAGLIQPLAGAWQAATWPAKYYTGLRKKAFEEKQIRRLSGTGGQKTSQEKNKSESGQATQASQTQRPVHPASRGRSPGRGGSSGVN